MERLALRSSSSRAKIMGTIVSISGAFVVTLYRGPSIINRTSQPNSVHLPQMASTQSNWVIGGLFLAADNLLLPIWYIVQAQVVRDYPAELIVVFLYNLCTTAICATVCFIAEKNFSAWIVRPDVSLAAILYSGLFGSFFATAIHTWGLRLKGPVYVAMFRPLSIAIAAALGVMFLGDTLYLGSIVGAIIISIGFYVVMRGKAKEEKGEDQTQSTQQEHARDG